MNFHDDRSGAGGDDMQFQLNTDANIQGDERLAEVAETLVTAGLGHMIGRLSRVEVHLADVNGAKGGGDDIRCTLEARPEGMQPQTVTHSDANVEAALRGASKKIRALLESEFGKLERR
jgi:hypothetical protein